MSLTQVGSSVVSEATATNAAVPVPSGLSGNDLAVVTGVIFYPADADTVTPPAGFSVVPGVAYRMTATAATNDDFQIVSYYKYISGDSGTWNFAWTNSATRIFMCDVVRGAPTSSPIDPASTTRHTTYSGSFPAASQTWTGLTLEQANEFVLAWFANDMGFSVSVSGWSQRYSQTGFNLLDKLFTASGATGSITSVATNSCDQTATLVAIRSASAAVVPVNSVLPAITDVTSSGRYQAGDQLSCSSGTWTGSPTLTYQWNRGATVVGTNSTYTLQGADVGSQISCTVTAHNSAGDVSATSTLTSVVTAGGSALIPTVGEVLECSSGGWANGPTSFSYQWQRCDAAGENPISIGADSSSYTVVSADIGHTIRCQVLAHNTNPRAGVMTSNPTGIVQDVPAPPDVTGLTLSISGTHITWSAVTGATNYMCAISTDPRPHVASTTYYWLGNVTSWDPPTSPGQTLYYGVMDNSTNQWSTNEVSIVWPGTPPTSQLLRVSINNTNGWGATIGGGRYPSNLFTDIGVRWNRYDVGQGGGMGTVTEAHGKNSAMKTLVMYTQGSDGNGNGLTTGQVTSDINALIPGLNSYFASTGQPKELEFLNESYITLNGIQYAALYHAAHVLTAPAGIKLLAVAGTQVANQQNGGSGSWFSDMAAHLPGGVAEVDAFTHHPYAVSGNLTDPGNGFWPCWGNIVSIHNEMVSAGFSPTLPWYFTELGVDLSRSGVTLDLVASKVTEMLNDLITHYPWVVYFNWYAAFDDSEATDSLGRNWGMLNKPAESPTVRPAFTAYQNWIAAHSTVLTS